MDVTPLAVRGVALPANWYEFVELSMAPDADAYVQADGLEMGIDSEHDHDAYAFVKSSVRSFWIKRPARSTQRGLGSTAVDQCECYCCFAHKLLQCQSCSNNTCERGQVNQL